MDLHIKEAQEVILDIFSRTKSGFALSGGTALELYYLKHRFSADLDFFSVKYNLDEIEDLISGFKKYNKKIKLETELTIGGRARVRFYTLPVKGTERYLKIDFIEDVLIKNPKIKMIKGVPVYGVEDIYFQKLAAIGGTKIEEGITGRAIVEGGRIEAKDIFDIYMLSKKIKPLNVFLNKTPEYLQKGIINWYQSFSRQEFKLGFLDLDIYDKTIDSREIIIYLEKQIKDYVKGIIE